MAERLLALAILAALAAGSVLHVLEIDTAAHAVWAASAAVALVPLAWSVAKALARRDVGVDAIALVAIAGALALGEYLAGSIIALMLSGGNALEATAGRRARRELTKLVERAPRIAHLRRGEAVEEVPVDAVHPGDVVLVRPGEVVPADGVVAAQSAVIDESALTGEPLPVELRRGGAVRSGTANAGAAFDLRVTRPAAESAYAALVRLVREAERHRAPFVRLADRYAAIFLPVSLAVAGAAWAAGGDAKRGRCCSTRRARSRSAPRRWTGSSASARSPSWSCSASPPRSTSSPPTRWPRRSSTTRNGAGSSSPSRPTPKRGSGRASRAPSAGTASRSARARGSRRTAMRALPRTRAPSTTGTRRGARRCSSASMARSPARS